jgi:hypothetical protein
MVMLYEGGLKTLTTPRYPVYPVMSYSVSRTGYIVGYVVRKARGRMAAGRGGGLSATIFKEYLGAVIGENKADQKLQWIRNRMENTTLKVGGECSLILSLWLSMWVNRLRNPSLGVRSLPFKA